MRALDYVAITAFVTALIALPFCFYNLGRHPIRSILVFGIPMFAFFFACWTSQEIGRLEVLRQLKSLKQDGRLLIKGNTVANSNELISDFEALDWLPAHHSHPTKTINVEIANHTPRLVLSLRRDSDNPREYYVFWPKYHVTSYNSVGSIKTTLLDDY